MAQAHRVAEIPCSLIQAVKALFSPRGHRSALTSEQASSVIHEDVADNRDMFDKLLLWEQNQLSEPETLAFFQELVDTGLAWKSTGAIRRTAAMLIRDGRIHR
jgi:hypothetical protein